MKINTYAIIDIQIRKFFHSKNIQNFVLKYCVNPNSFEDNKNLTRKRPEPETLTYLNVSGIRSEHNTQQKN